MGEQYERERTPLYEIHCRGREYPESGSTFREESVFLKRAVHRVEEDMDIILFKRTPEGLRPTPEGEVYLQAAGEILAMYDELKQDAAK